jgi:hypothetical protein
MGAGGGGTEVVGGGAALEVAGRAVGREGCRDRRGGATTCVGGREGKITGLRGRLGDSGRLSVHKTGAGMVALDARRFRRPMTSEARSFAVLKDATALVSSTVVLSAISSAMDASTAVSSLVALSVAVSSVVALWA